MTSKILIALIHSFIWCFLLGFASLANAQSFSVSPAKLIYPLEGGQSGYRHITVTNYSNYPKTYSVTKGDFLMNENGGVRRFEANTLERSCAEWMMINPQTFELAPNESIKVRISIVVPDGEEMTKWAELYIQQEQELANFPALADKALQSKIRQKGRIAIPVLQSPKSNMNYDATIANFREAKDINGKPLFLADLQNTGDKLVTGEIVRNVVDLETGEKISLPPMAVSLLPNVNRTIEFPLPEELQSGNYNLTTIWKVDYQKNPKGVRKQIVIN